MNSSTNLEMSCSSSESITLDWYHDKLTYLLIHASVYFLVCIVIESQSGILCQSFQCIKDKNGILLLVNFECYTSISMENVNAVWNVVMVCSS